MKPADGFTLIELLIVIAVIAILSTIGIAILGPALEKARDAKRKSDVEDIAKAFESKFDPVPGTYTNVSGADFEDGEIPTPPGGTGLSSYAITLNASTDGFLVCTELEGGGGNSVSSSAFIFDEGRSPGDYDFYCTRNAQGEKVAFAPQPAAVPTQHQHQHQHQHQPLPPPLHQLQPLHQHHHQVLNLPQLQTPS